MSNRILLITSWLPISGHWTSTAGIARRQSILVDAVKRTGLAVDVLMICSPTQFDGSLASADAISASLKNFWGKDINVSVCGWTEQTEVSTLFQKYIKPAINYLQQRDFGRFNSPAVRLALAAIITEKTQSILVQGLRCMAPVLSSGKNKIPVFFDMDDVEHVSFRRRVAEPPVWPSKRLQYLQIPALIFAEYIAIKRASATFVCSILDQRKLQQLFRTNKIHALPNAMPLRDLGPPNASQSLLILGHYGFAPNRVGVDHFVNHVWPLIYQQLPAAQVFIGGADAQLLDCYEAKPAGVVFTGYVKDLDSLYTKVRAVVCPILSGGGTRLKIMEASACGRPVISTRIGAEGIDLKEESEILIADAPDEMAAACCRLLTDWKLAQQIGVNSKKSIDMMYSRDQIVTTLATLLTSRYSL